MNAKFLALLSAGLIGGLASIVAAPAAPYSPMKIIQTDAPIYPRRVIDLGILNGFATVAVQVDEKGNLTDHLVTSYSHKAFAEAAVNAIKKWRFEPAWLNGEPRGASSELTFDFESQGLVVVDLTVTRYVEMRDYQLRPGAYSFGVRRMSQIDRIPTPTKVVKPAYPIEPSQPPRAANVTVSFYIDENGRVRMPTISRETDPADEIFAAVAVEAVSQWEFEPPTSGGVPVLVFARQEFNFRPDQPVASGGMTAQTPTQ